MSKLDYVQMRGRRGDSWRLSSLISTIKTFTDAVIVVVERNGARRCSRFFLFIDNTRENEEEAEWRACMFRT